MIYLGIAIGFISSIILEIIYRWVFKTKKKEYSRIGIYESQFETIVSNIKYTFTCEVGEIDSGIDSENNNVSKVEIISSRSSLANSNDSFHKSTVHNCWIPSDRIKWISNTKSKDRSEKISKIINK